MKNICVFCGSNFGLNGVFREAARELGGEMARRGIGLVYGGGSVGLMGTIADTVLGAGGQVVGVIPEALATKELLHAGVTRMHVVPSMHARKALMSELADGFIALPGGFGTLEELFETITWAQLGLHRKTIGVLNVASYFDPLLELVANAIAEQFVWREFRNLFVVDSTPRNLLESMIHHRMPDVQRWLRRGET